MPAREAGLGEVVAVASPNLDLIVVVELVDPADHVGEGLRRLYCAVRMMGGLFVYLYPAHKASFEGVIEAKGCWLRKGLCNSLQSSSGFVGLRSDG